MFHFSHPKLLFLALVLPPLLAWWLVQRRGSVRHPVASRLTWLPAGRSGLALWGGTALRFLALGSLVVAAAGPRWADRKTHITTEGIAIVMVADVSGSMATPDFDWKGRPKTRLRAVKNAFRLFVEGGEAPDGSHLEGRKTDRIGLVVFGTRPDAVCPLTLSHSALLRIMEEQQARSIPGESQTNLSDAIALGLSRLRSAGPRRKVLILLSDGEHNVVSPASTWTPRQVAHVAAGLKVPIYAIDAAGSGLSVPEPGGTAETSVEVREAAVQTLRSVAAISGGQYFRADSTPALLEVYRQIDRREREPAESNQFRRYHEGYPWFALASFVLFAGALVLEMTVWRRVP
jgi:Ca-activated chloride channel family protein